MVYIGVIVVVVDVIADVMVVNVAVEE